MITGIIIILNSSWFWAYIAGDPSDQWLLDVSSSTEQPNGTIAIMLTELNITDYPSMAYIIQQMGNASHKSFQNDENINITELMSFRVLFKEPGLSLVIGYKDRWYWWNYAIP